MQRQKPTKPTPAFIIAALPVPVDRDSDLRYSLTAYGIKIVSRRRGGAHQHVYCLAVPDHIALWKFIAARLGPYATDAQVDEFIALHVRRIEPGSQIH